MIFKKLTSSFVETFVQFCTLLRTYKKRTDILVRYFGSFCARFAFSCTFLQDLAQLNADLERISHCAHCGTAILWLILDYRGRVGSFFIFY